MNGKKSIIANKLKIFLTLLSSVILFIGCQPNVSLIKNDTPPVKFESVPTRNKEKEFFDKLPKQNSGFLQAVYFNIELSSAAACFKPRHIIKVKKEKHLTAVTIRFECG